MHQGSALSPYLFILVLDELLKWVVQEVSWCMPFADDMVLISETEQSGGGEDVRTGDDGTGEQGTKGKQREDRTHGKPVEG